jgi:phage gp29-like protein
MKESKLLERVASYATAYDFTALLRILPDPDPILRKRGADLGIYRDLLSDSHLFACIQSRKAGTLGRPWAIELPDGAEDNARNRQILEFVDRAFQRLDVERVVAEIVDAPFWGYTPFEYIWRAEGDKVAYEDITGLPPEWFAWTPDGEPRFLTKNAPLEGEEIDARKFLFARHYPSYVNPYGERIFSKVFWPIIFKKGGLKFWFIFTEKYGMPWALLKHPRGASEKEIAKLLAMGVTMVQDGVAAIPDDDSIELVDAASRASSAAVYEKLKDACNFEISKAVLGQTLTTEIGDTGSRAAATVHLVVRDDIVDSDHRLVETTMDAAIARLVAENFDDEPLSPVFRIVEKDRPADENERKNIELGWRMGILGEAHARKRLHIPEPAGDDRLLPPPQLGPTFAAGDPAFAEQRQPRRRRPKFPSHIEEAARPAADAAYEGLTNAVKGAVGKCRSYEDLAALKAEATDAAARALGAAYHGIMLHAYLQGRADVADDMRSILGPESFAERPTTDFVTPEAAIKYFQNKVPLSPEEYKTLSSSVRRRAFTMAGVQHTDLLANIQAEGVRAMAEGRTFAGFKADVDAAFDRVGVTRANSFHLETVFVNNLSQAYNAGLYDELHGDVAERLFPYLRYRTMRDVVVRPEHAAIEGIILLRDDSFWESNWPQNGHRCRCWVEGVTAEEAKGLRISKGAEVPNAYAPGFDSSPREYLAG